MGTRIPKWAYAITKFLTIGELLVKKEEAMKVKNKVAMFILLNGTLYKRGFSLPLLRYISPNEDQNHSGEKEPEIRVLLASCP
ncbi:hypothetical protein I3760_15G093400 [Carya illinoinensis]|nr:hypothetical protein I3760_15G093400 [Carya illinoinensis]